MMGKKLPEEAKAPESVMYLYSLFVRVKNATRGVLNASAILDYCKLYQTHIRADEAEAIMIIDSIYQTEVTHG